MGKLFLIIIIGVTVVTAVARPWIGIVSYYMLALLGPQYIWPWVFEEIRVSLFVAVSAVVGAIITLLKGRCDLSFMNNRQNKILLMLFSFVLLSYFAGAYVNLEHALYDPSRLIGMSSKIILFYLCAVLMINDIVKIKCFYLVLVATTIFLIFWANIQYLSQNWNQFNGGRLMGPHAQGSIYGDENAFGMLFVTGLPFIYFLGTRVREKWLRYALWAVLPLGCHAVFLTGSRGALLGMGSTILINVLRSKNRLLPLTFLLVLALFFQWQGGSVMKTRSSTIASYEGESSAESRLTAWTAGLKMVRDHPLTGVGIGSFMTALPNYSDAKPLIAHNTLVQYLAESGLGAGLCYLLLAFNYLKNS